MNLQHPHKKLGVAIYLYPQHFLEWSQEHHRDLLAANQPVFSGVNLSQVKILNMIEHIIFSSDLSAYRKMYALAKT